MIYFVKANEAVKIGFTKNKPKIRISDLQVGNPVKLEMVFLTKGDIYAEREFHKAFDAYRIRGEWFEFSDVIQSFVEEYKDLDIRSKYGLVPEQEFKIEGEHLNQLQEIRTRRKLTPQEVASILELDEAETILALDKFESFGNLTINQLRNLSEALDCEFQYRIIDK